MAATAYSELKLQGMERMKAKRLNRLIRSELFRLLEIPINTDHTINLFGQIAFHFDLFYGMAKQIGLIALRADREALPLKGDIHRLRAPRIAN